MLGRRLTEFYPDPPVPRPEPTPALSSRRAHRRSRPRPVGDRPARRDRRGHRPGRHGARGTASAARRAKLARTGNGHRRGHGRARGHHRPAARAIDAGVALVPGNRHRDGCWLDGSATENVTLPSLRNLRGRFGQIHRRRESAVASHLLTLSGVRPLAPLKPMRELSGGNQQKVVLSKWLNEDPRVLVLDEPTQGVDAGAAKELLEHVTGLAERGAAVVLCSGDYEQIAAVCHRAIVLSHGHIVAELAGDGARPRSPCWRRAATTSTFPPDVDEAPAGDGGAPGQPCRLCGGTQGGARRAAAGGWSKPTPGLRLGEVRAATRWTSDGRPSCAASAVTGHAQHRRGRADVGRRAVAGRGSAPTVAARQGAADGRGRRRARAAARPWAAASPGATRPRSCSATLVALDTVVETDRRTLGAQDVPTGRWTNCLAPGEVVTRLHFRARCRSAPVSRSSAGPISRGRRSAPSRCGRTGSGWCCSVPARGPSW